jgi:hypothetical protein
MNFKASLSYTRPCLKKKKKKKKKKKTSWASKMAQEKKSLAA